jgi:hypothetical protein
MAVVFVSPRRLRAAESPGPGPTAGHCQVCVKLLATGAVTGLLSPFCAPWCCQGALDVLARGGTPCLCGRKPLAIEPTSCFPVVTVVARLGLDGSLTPSHALQGVSHFPYNAEMESPFGEGTGPEELYLETWPPSRKGQYATVTLSALRGFLLSRGLGMSSCPKDKCLGDCKSIKGQRSGSRGLVVATRREVCDLSLCLFL